VLFLLGNLSRIYSSSTTFKDIPTNDILNEIQKSELARNRIANPQKVITTIELLGLKPDK